MPESIIVSVLTGPSNGGTANLDRREFDLRSGKGQRWFMTHLYWAMNNNQNVVLMPAKEAKPA